MDEFIKDHVYEISWNDDFVSEGIGIDSKYYLKIGGKCKTDIDHDMDTIGRQFVWPMDGGVEVIDHGLMCPEVKKVFESCRTKAK